MNRHLTRAVLLACASSAIAAGSAQAAYTSAVAGATVTMTGDAAGDTLLLDQVGGLLRHSRFPGDPGFHSAFDFDSATPNDQTISAVDPAKTVKVNAGGGTDTLTIGTPAAPGTAMSTAFEYDGGALTDTFVLDGSGDPTARDFAWTATGQSLVVGTGSWFHPGVEVVSARLGLGNDMVRVASTDPNGSGTLDSGAGEDLFVFGQSGTSLATVVGPISVDAGDGTDSLVFGDSAQPGRHSYSIGSTTFNRDELGVVTFAGAESARLNSSTGPDNVFKRGSIPFRFDTGTSTDYISSIDSVSDTVNCGDGDDLVFADLLDSVSSLCENISKTDTTPPSPPPPPPPEPDSKPPVVVVHAPLVATRKKLLKGVFVTVQSDEASSVVVEERARLKSKSYNLTLGRASLPAAAVAGFRALKLKANPRLVGKSKGFSVRFFVTVVDAAGNRTVATQAMKVRLK